MPFADHHEIISALFNCAGLAIKLDRGIEWWWKSVKQPYCPELDGLFQVSMVTDACSDAQVQDSSLVRAYPFLRFLYKIPLEEQGDILLLDDKPREWTRKDAESARLVSG